MNVSKRILVLGAGGMLGSTLIKYFHLNNHQVFGTIRDTELPELELFIGAKKLIKGCDLLENQNLKRAFEISKPEVVINCAGVLKWKISANDITVPIMVNSLLPHQVRSMCASYNSRLIQISTDCVYSGKRGNYSEADLPDPVDVYGQTKLLGEVDGDNTVILRTSIVGHELKSSHNLLNWFLSSEGSVDGYKDAIFSGLPTTELASVIDRYLLCNDDIYGLYHVSQAPIDKYSLLTMFAEIYGKRIQIRPSKHVKVNRSLNCEKFQSKTGYVPRDWAASIESLREFWCK